MEKISDITALDFDAASDYFTARFEKSLKDELDLYSWSRAYRPILYALEGGKRIRSLITLFASEAVHNQGREDPALAAVAVELLHTESIIHDDLIDQTMSRREKMSFHVKYGYGASLLTADFVFGIILSIASRYSDSRVAKELSKVALKMCDGEFGELKLDPKGHQISWQEYTGLIDEKTASLFETAAKLGAILGGGSDQEINVLAEFGQLTGMAFQIKDDILDWGNSSDLTEALELVLKEDDPLKVLEDAANRYSKNAKEKLNSITPSPAVEHLKKLADLAVTRDS